MKRKPLPIVSMAINPTKAQTTQRALAVCKLITEMRQQVGVDLPADK